MNITKEQKREAYQKLSPEAQNFVMDNETTDLIASFLKETDLTEEQKDSADSEILYAMLGLQTLPDAIENIAKSAGKDPFTFFKLKEKLDEQIFSNIPTTAVETEKPKDNFVGLDVVRQISKEILVPTYAISGITTENVDELIKVGIKRVAVSSGVLSHGDVCQTARAFSDRLK